MTLPTVLSRLLGHLARPGAITAPWAVAGETLLLSLLPIALGQWFSPLDPLWLHGGFPWLWLPPVLLALRYGPLPGLASGALLLLVWLALHQSGRQAGDFPEASFLGGLILVMLSGEFSSVWMTRNRRAEAMQHYLDQRLEFLTHQYYLLRLSHDRLEQDLLTRPMAMRDALAALASPPAESDTPALSGADALLRLLAQYCQIESACLLALRDGKPDPLPVASIGQSSDADLADPLLRHCLENNALSHVAAAQPAGQTAPRYLVAAPITTHDRQQIGLLLVERMPFFALNEETLQTLNLLLSYYADGLVRERLAAALQAEIPHCPDDFAFELQRLTRLQEESGVNSILVALDFPADAEFADLQRQMARQKRGLDVLWDFAHGQRRVLATLMPLGGEAAAEGYLARIESWILQQTGQGLADNGIVAHLQAVDASPASRQLRRLLKICHVDFTETGA